MSYITGVGLTSYGRHEGSSSLDLMSKAAALAIADAGLKRAEIDGILCGYSTVSCWRLSLPSISGSVRLTRMRCRSAVPRDWP